VTGVAGYQAHVVVGVIGANIPSQVINGLGLDKQVYERPAGVDGDCVFEVGRLGLAEHCVDPVVTLLPHGLQYGQKNLSGLLVQHCGICHVVRQSV
jgi:hypothetical protein